MLKRVWERIKATLDRLFRRKREITVADEKREATRWEDMARRVSPSRNYPNMPKRQPCPLCRAMVKRIRKTMGGAHYYCKKCKSGAFVRAR